ncbi:hypothetical protein BP6252_06828 [Coleophoma cylindrospora]|uniref:Uncharacterized protein n=1 Tax=Coleophoma cylindrospora TaxID=1849047 RepID=A0A3D8RGD0_9HELO|nr:hypothetical protein BP6252_06828 [Coleophoma cylindrospora]
MAVTNALEEATPILKPQYVAIFLALSYIIYFFGRLVYNIYLHPLSSYPGPASYAATDIPFVRALLNGNLTYETHELHKKYGEVIRIAPDELSYISAEAWRDIYGHRVGRPQVEKSRPFYDTLAGGAPSIVTAPTGDHSRFRRLLSHAFSEKAMREQESLIKVYVDLLIQRLRETSGKPTDIVQWYNWTTFDIFGDLCFGESFQCVEKSSYHPWVSMLFESIKLGAIMMAASRYPLLNSLAAKLTPSSLLAKRDAHNQMAEQKVAKRREFKTDRADFMSFILKHNDKSGMTDAEINSNAAILIIAGSETTATLMSGATYLLLQNPDVLEKLVRIIRETFASEDEITIQSVSNLKYLLAVLDESLRMYPPVPVGLPRTVGPNGDAICGKWVPGNTTVSVNQWASFRSPMNFTDPESFLPDRFMGEPRFASDNLAAFQPFSTGPRNCIGRNLAYAEMRLIITRILWNFDLEAHDNVEAWANQKIYTLWEKGPLMVKLRPMK